jgi:hypothetical protein
VSKRFVETPAEIAPPPRSAAISVHMEITGESTKLATSQGPQEGEEGEEGEGGWCHVHFIPHKIVHPRVALNKIVFPSSVI